MAALRGRGVSVGGGEEVGRGGGSPLCVVLHIHTPDGPCERKCLYVGACVCIFVYVHGYRVTFSLFFFSRGRRYCVTSTQGILVSSPQMDDEN